MLLHFFLNFPSYRCNSSSQCLKDSALSKLSLLNQRMSSRLRQSEGKHFGADRLFAK